MLIDTHCHIEKSDVVKTSLEAKEDGVLKCVVSLCEYDEFTDIDDYIDIDDIYVTVGIHPLEVAKSNYDISIIEDLIKEKEVVAIGETGLDYYYQKENKKDQIDVFRYHLSLAEKYNLPVVIHSRDAVMDTLSVLDDYNVRGVIHCFSGSIEIAREYIKRGFYLGIGGVVTFKNSNLASVVKELSLDNIILETDSPYLSPNRGEVNHPRNIKIIAEYIADIKGLTFEEIADRTTANAYKLFDLQ